MFYTSVYIKINGEFMKKSHLLTLLLSSTFLVACGGSGGGGGGGSSVGSANGASEAYPNLIKDTVYDNNSTSLESLKQSYENSFDELIKFSKDFQSNKYSKLLFIDALDLVSALEKSARIAGGKIESVDATKIKFTDQEITDAARAIKRNEQTFKEADKELKTLYATFDAAYNQYSKELRKNVINDAHRKIIELDVKDGLKSYYNARDSISNGITQMSQNYKSLMSIVSYINDRFNSGEEGVNRRIDLGDVQLFKASIKQQPEDITTKRGPLTTATMRQGENGSIDLRESFGQKFDVKLPLHVRVVGDTNLKETSSTLGSVFYKAGNTLFGVAQAYANQGNNFDVNGNQMETSAVSTFTLGKAFAEFQSGIVSADKVSGSNWSGSRQAMFLGYDMAGGISPFVQVSARQLSQENGVTHAENGAYLGTTVDATKTNAFFNTTTLMTVKSGLVSDKASLGAHSRTDSFIDHSVHMEQGFGAEGVSFNTSVGLSTKQKTTLKISVGFSQ